jgi:hypothetical protein
MSLSFLLSISIFSFAGVFALHAINPQPALWQDTNDYLAETPIIPIQNSILNPIIGIGENLEYGYGQAFDDDLKKRVKVWCDSNGNWVPTTNPPTYKWVVVADDTLRYFPSSSREKIIAPDISSTGHKKLHFIWDDDPEQKGADDPPVPHGPFDYTVVGVESLLSDQPEREIDDGDGDDDTKTYLVAYREGETLDLTAAPTPDQPEHLLPESWNLKGGIGSGKFSRTIDLSQAGTHVLDASCGTSSKTTTVHVVTPYELHLWDGVNSALVDGTPSDDTPIMDTLYLMQDENGSAQAYHYLNWLPASVAGKYFRWKLDDATGWRQSAGDFSIGGWQANEWTEPAGGSQIREFILTAWFDEDGDNEFSEGIEPHRRLKIVILKAEIVPDFNRDGIIDDSDRFRVTYVNPWRWWINDDDDLPGTERGENAHDRPGQPNSDAGNSQVDGMRDLIDFFPLHLDLPETLRLLPPSEYRYSLSQADEALNFYEYGACRPDGSEADRRPDQRIKSVAFGRKRGTTELARISDTGTALGEDYLEHAKEGKGVVLVEGRASTTEPLALRIIRKSDEQTIATLELPLRIAGVEDMYRQLNLRPLSGGEGGIPTRTGEPPAYPDSLTNGKYFVYVHGYNVDGESARGSQSNLFKRLHQLGSHARFVGVFWHGTPNTPGLNLLLPPDYHRAVQHGLSVGSQLKTQLSFTQGSSLTLLAHSLGNSVVGNAIANHGLRADHYYMINSAIALEAYDSKQTGNSSQHDDMKRNMTEDDWKPYYDHGDGEQQRLFASNWHELFDPATDNRGKLTWKNLFDQPELLNVAYNFFSPSDEVVENPDGTEEVGDWDNIWALRQGRHAWVSQEIAKGGQNAIAYESFHDVNGGWQFHYNPLDSDPWSRGYVQSRFLVFPRKFTPQEAADEISDANLTLKPFHKPFLYHDLYDPEKGSSVAGQPNVLYHLLATSIPATSYAAATNAMNPLGAQRNFEMPIRFKSPEAETDWPVKFKKRPNAWLHSDFKDVALPFLYPLYQRMIHLAQLDQTP